MILTDVLYEKFGYKSFRVGQQEIIEAVLRKEDVIALLPTGMGKSLCYQLPGYVLDGPVLVISPLLSLMQDQVDQLKKLGEKRVVAFNSFLSQEQKQYALHFLHQYRFIFVSPEMLAQASFQARFREIQFALIVVDEAHCISQWGYDFRPDYLRLKEFIQMVQRAPILALTATATNEVIEDVKAYLQMNEPFQFIHSIDRPNIKIVKNTFSSRNEKKDWIIKHLMETAGPGIVYMQSRSRANELAMELTHLGLAVAAYHAGLENEDRQFIQQQFILGHLDWVIATNAFGMGVHKNDIRQVIHEAMPATIANYMQEIGRAGRDGEQSIATILYCPGDEETAAYIASEDVPSNEQLAAFLHLNVAKYDPNVHFSEHRITETMHRVLSYWLSVETIEQVQLRLAQIRQNKQYQVREMAKLLQEERCIREQVLQYFGQTLEERLEICCSNCGVDRDALYLERNRVSKASMQLDWQVRLQSLLS